MLAPLSASSIPCLRAGAPADSALHARVTARIAALPGPAIAADYRDAVDRWRLSIGAATEFHAASTMTMPVTIEFFRRADAGSISVWEDAARRR